MYDRKVGKQELNFTVSGMLWKRSLIMRDDETKTLWSHILGKGMKGKLKGTELEVIPSEMTSWKTWRTAHAETDVVVMSRTSGNYNLSIHGDGSRYVLGLRKRKAARAYPFHVLEKSPLVQEKVGDLAVVVTYDAAAFTARAFERVVQGKPIEFQTGKWPKMIDQGTGSSWDPVSGKCLSGKLKGEQLRLLPGIPSFRKVWQVFHPSSTEYKVE